MTPHKTRPRREISGKKHFLLASDFDKTLSFNDSGYVLSELLGITNFETKVHELSERNLVQQGGELAYLLLHDAEFRAVRRAHLIEAGKHIHLKNSIPRFCKILQEGIDDLRFSFYVISAAPQEVIQAALDGIVPKENIIGTRFDYDAEGQISSLIHLPAGYGKVFVLKQLQSRLQIGDQRIVYCGDGSSDIHVMLHVNQRKGYTIAVSQAEYVTQIAKRTVLSDDAASVLVPFLEDLCAWDASRIRAFFENQGLLIQEWAKMRTDWLTIRADANEPV